jgi:hypothetical protein
MSDKSENGVDIRGSFEEKINEVVKERLARERERIIDEVRAELLKGIQADI